MGAVINRLLIAFTSLLCLSQAGCITAAMWAGVLDPNMHCGGVVGVESNGGDCKGAPKAIVEYSQAAYDSGSNTQYFAVPIGKRSVAITPVSLQATTQPASEWGRLLGPQETKVIDSFHFTGHDVRDRSAIHFFTKEENLIDRCSVDLGSGNARPMFCALSVDPAGRPLPLPSRGSARHAASQPRVEIRCLPATMHRRPGDYFGNMGAAILETPFTLIGDVIMTPIDLLEVFSGGR